MLFDHECDVIVTVMNCFILEKLLQVGNKANTMRTMMTGTCPFYYVLLEQYYTGEMNFPMINGVDEGTAFYVIVCIVTGYIGSERFWTTNEFNIFNDKPLNSAVVTFL